jgi:cysteinyl-tRNA synthetase
MTEGEKMSKSLGNFYTVHDLLKEFPGEAIRLVLLQTHYRQPLDFTKDGIAQARHTLDRFYSALRAATEVDVEAGGFETSAAAEQALADDINTPAALAHLHDALGALNKAEGPEDIARHKAALLAGGKLLGLLEQNPEDWFRWRPEGVETFAEAEIDRLIEKRAQARKAKDFATADAVRDELAANGVQLEDRPEGTIWRRG